MATYLAKLIQIRDEATDRLLECLLKPKLNYSVDGQSFSWTDYQRMLNDQIKSLNDLIRGEEGPFELESEGYTGGF